jgi:hypothetical protein
MQVFKIRASACGQIMTEAKGSVTEKQLATINELLAKQKLTEKQQETLNDLIFRRDNPELSETAKSYCKSWLKGQPEYYNRKKEFSSKYTQKGLVVEDNSLDFIADMLDLGMLYKNEEFFEDEFMIGTPDVVLPDFIFDAKNSWDQNTFPAFENDIPTEGYEWQLQVYMALTGRKHAKLIYVLSDTPLNLIEKEAYFWCKNNGYDELEQHIYEEFVARMTYPDVKPEHKIKIFNIDRDDRKIEAIRNRVIECRKYIATLSYQREINVTVADKGIEIEFNMSGV